MNLSIPHHPLEVEDEASCPEPHHQSIAHDEAAHRAHHWKERAVCMSFCAALHVVLEILTHVFWH